MSSPIFDGEAVQLFSLDPATDLGGRKLGEGFYEVVFFNKKESVNKFDETTLQNFKSSVDELKKLKPKGVLVSSGKDAFIVGADIMSFGPLFQKPESEILSWLQKSQSIFNAFEDLDCPSVVSINGFALGGGFEMALSCTYRVGVDSAKVGQPEVKLGLIPGFGGTVRLSRVIGVDNALEWICQGGDFSAEAALKVGAIDAVTTKEKLRLTSLRMVSEASQGQLNWKSKRQEKLEKLHLRSKVEHKMIFEGAKGFIYGQTKGQYPAPMEALSVIEAGSQLNRDEALALEAKGFVKMAKTAEAKNLIGIFLADQFVKKENKNLAKKSKSPTQAAVLGAGIMGGGIAYQSASRGIPILMKDIQTSALDMGMNEAKQLVGKQVERKKLDFNGAAKTLGSIHPTLSYAEIGIADVIVEAVVENEKIKAQVLSELESHIKSDVILASNTSTISISRLAQNLKNPERFCGIHFFNPVHKMPLVEVIRGAKTSEDTMSKAVSYVLALGKTPIVVNDCPGFLVNRVLFPYLQGFAQVVSEGVHFEAIDKVMEKWGWPMGPAYLSDVVGLDTAHHAAQVMQAGFPDRMIFKDGNPIHALMKMGRLGQKSGSGFYKYTKDKKGIPQKAKDSESINALGLQNPKEMNPEMIVHRLMIPMMTESIRCLEEKIVKYPIEVDLALINGLGFPPFRGGIFRVIDQIGTQELVKLCDSLSNFGAIYSAPKLLKEIAAKKESFYGLFEKGGLK